MPSTPWFGNILVITSIMPDLPSRNPPTFVSLNFFLGLDIYLEQTPDPL
jgi:hypothetical protein